MQCHLSKRIMVVEGLNSPCAFLPSDCSLFHRHPHPHRDFKYSLIFFFPVTHSKDLNPFGALEFPFTAASVT